MNKAKLKSYAPIARKDFIAAVTARANLLGLSESGGKPEVAPGERKGDIAIIAGREWPAKVYEQRERLIERMKRDGFSQTVEAVAYTWFNRFAALRYMEIHDYLDHGYRVLSNREGGMPEILNHATELDLPGFNKSKAVELKLAGNKDNELYKLILVAQCNVLSSAMPFLFERIDDETELLLPENLLRTDSIIAKLVEEIPEEDWAQVEIIGWLYQFYISEKKDEVIGKVVKSEDIPAATQLFTPNWIVQYLVQNSVGRLWLMANPQSTLAQQWPYYITPAEQTPEVQAQLDVLIQTRVRDDGDTLNPESITLLDPACGSGHILVEAYEVLKGIYLERGYRLRDIPRLILEKNIYGIDIDDRAAQMASFALLMKARADDRRLFDTPPKLNVLALQEGKEFNADALIIALQSAAVDHASPKGVTINSIAELIALFAHAKTFGSLIQIPPALNAALPDLLQSVLHVIKSGDLYTQAAAQDLLPLVTQAIMLGMQFDVVVANPPYMGSQYHVSAIKDFLKLNFKGFEKDLFAAFTLRNARFCRRGGEVAIMSSNVWMFLYSYEEMRDWLIKEKSLNTLIQLSNSGFDGATVFVCAFTFTNQFLGHHKGSFVRLVDFSRPSDQGPKALEAIQNPNCGWFFKAKPNDFKKIPGCPIAYWVSDKLKAAFSNGILLKEVANPKKGLATTDNNRFLRYWFEVSVSDLGLNFKDRDQAATSGKKWFPLNKGGDFRKWYGNKEYVINWANDGKELKNAVVTRYGGGSYTKEIRSEDKYFKDGITWSALTSSVTSFRLTDYGALFDSAGSTMIPQDHSWQVLGLLNSPVVKSILSTINPTLNFGAGTVSSIPVVYSEFPLEINLIVDRITQITRNDWDSYELSWNFTSLPLAQVKFHDTKLADSYAKLSAYWQESSLEVKMLEEKNNDAFIKVYGLSNELSPEVTLNQVTLTCNPHYRYANNKSESDLNALLMADTIKETISYAIGCMMGRYSLDEPGLIYAHAGNIGFDPDRYKIFPADADGIVPVTDLLWFEDDAASRIREFLLSVWNVDTANENIAWLAEGLGNKGNETPEETIRRYLTSSFYKNHLQTYKKRPIYWLFSSGKQGAFQALVYLHRYNEGTLARMRSEYVVPLTGKMLSRIEMLEKDATSAGSTSERTKINKEIEVLRKQHIELLVYDEKLRHYADMRIELDLDDGVKVNYGKFGDLLAEVKAVTGGSGDD